MAILTVSAQVPSGATFTPVAAAGGGDSFANDGATSLYVKNGSGAPITVTIPAQAACNFGVSNAAHDIVRAVPAGAENRLGPFAPGLYNDANGRVQITYSGVTSLTVVPFK